MNLYILIDEIIKFKISDENSISQVFDRMLSLEFINEEVLKELYFKLLNYTKNINKELCEDYKEIYQEKNIKDDIKVLEKNYRKYICNFFVKMIYLI